MARQRKLPPGMTKRGDVYHACFRSGGRLIRKRLSSDFDAARQNLNELRARADRADFGLLDNDVPLDEIRKAYERHCRLTTKPRTQDRTRQCLDAILTGVSAKRVKQLSEGVINAYREARLVEVSPRTVNMDVSALSTMLKWAVTTKRIGANPLAQFKPLPTRGKEKKQRRALTIEEVQAVLEAAPERLKPIFRLLHTSGVRSGEACNLKFSDVDFDRAEITIRAGNSKNSRPRDISLDEEVLAMMERLYAEAPFRVPGTANTEKVNKRIAATFSKEHVFVTTAGTPFEVRRLLRRFYAICKRVGIEGAQPGGSVDIHALRGTVTTLALEGGANPREVQAINGHSTLKMTMDAYARSTSQGRRSVINALPFAKAARPKHAISMQSAHKARASESNAPSAATEVAAG